MSIFCWLPISSFFCIWAWRKHPSYLVSLLHYCLQTPFVAGGTYNPNLREAKNGCCVKEFVKVPSNCSAPGIWWTTKAPSTTLFMNIVKIRIKMFRFDCGELDSLISKPHIFYHCILHVWLVINENPIYQIIVAINFNFTALSDKVQYSASVKECEIMRLRIADQEIKFELRKV